MTIALTEDFMDSLGRLNGNEIKKASKTIMSIKKESDAKGLRAHKIDHPSDSIISFSVNMDIRIIAYLKDKSITFLYIDHHDDAYNWIKKRNVYCGPNNDIRIVSTLDSSIPFAYEATASYSKNKIKEVAITPDMIDDLRNINNDEELFLYIEKHPIELQEKLFDIALRALKAKSCKVSSKFAVKVINNDDILKAALLYPLDKWRIFIHPKQEIAINTPINQSALITGAPGTGKTVCLIHKAKKLEKDLKHGECILISTFRNALQDYLLKMLNALCYDPNKVFIVDVSDFINTTHDSQLILDGLIELRNNKLYFHKNKRKYLVRHILFDEYQDFSKGCLKKIMNMVSVVPFTISYDYSQSIYKHINRTVNLFEKFELPKIQKIILYYSYRINSTILIKLKRLMRLITILADSNNIVGDVNTEEQDVINNVESAIEGSDIKLVPYENIQERDSIIETEYDMMRGTYDSGDVVVTCFISDFYRHLAENQNFKCEEVPLSVRISYLYLPTLKGKEYKAGIIVLDDIICQLLNVNRILFERVDDSLMKVKLNARFYLNLLYVGISRFRDFLTIVYPNKYKEIITPILSS